MRQLLTALGSEQLRQSAGVFLFASSLRPTQLAVVLDKTLRPGTAAPSQMWGY
jgi:hypothetical protein